MTSACPIDTLAGAAAASAHGSLSPRQPVKPKHVQFELMFPETPQYRARLPLRVQIYPHDSTESIVTTVKNFYGLYPGPATSKGVSFEDDRGNTLIARYENFSNNMVVYVRVFEEAAQSATPFSATPYQPNSTSGVPSYMSSEFGPPLAQQYEPSHKPASHGTSRRRSTSPDSGHARRSESVGNGQPGVKKARSKSSKTLGSDCEHGYSSGDGASGSVSSKFKDQMGNTDISLENIVEGGRRKRAKFESSVRSTLVFASVRRGHTFLTWPLRNCHSSLLLRCPLPPPTPQCLLLAASSISDPLCLLLTLASIPLPILDHCSHLKATATLMVPSMRLPHPYMTLVGTAAA